MGVNTPIKVTASVRWGKVFLRGWLTHRAAPVLSAMKYIWYAPSPAITTKCHAAPNKMTLQQSGGIKELMAVLLTQLTELNDSAGSHSRDEKKLCVTTWPHKREEQIQQCEWPFFLLHIYPYLLTILLMWNFKTTPIAFKKSSGNNSHVWATLQ